MRLRPVWLVVALGACHGTADPLLINVEGTWNYTELLEDKLRGVSCSDTGAYRLSQVGDKFEGVYFQRGICRTANGGFFNSDSGVVSAGVVVGKTLRFAATPTCQYEGRVADAPSGEISGRGFCSLEISGLPHNFQGSWRAVRQP